MGLGHPESFSDGLQGKAVGDVTGGMDHPPFHHLQGFPVVTGKATVTPQNRALLVVDEIAGDGDISGPLGEPSKKS